MHLHSNKRTGDATNRQSNTCSKNTERTWAHKNHMDNFTERTEILKGQSDKFTVNQQTTKHIITNLQSSVISNDHRILALLGKQRFVWLTLMQKWPYSNALVGIDLLRRGHILNFSTDVPSGSPKRTQRKPNISSPLARLLEISPNSPDLRTRFTKSLEDILLNQINVYS